MFFLIGIFVVSLLASCQTIENGWKGIKPLHTNRIVVEKILGPAKVNDSGYYYYDYNTEDAYIQVNYSTAPCQDDKYKRGKFNVAENTVLDYSVILKNAVRITDFEFDKKKYYKETGGDVLNLATYRNYEDGVAIGVTLKKHDEIVNPIRFQPAKNDATKFACKK